MSFEVKIPLFEGPFDLLLFFIRRDELDIHDIPIAKITNDFLDYLSHLERLNMDVASEFMLVAATLMRIKAKMLLPRVEIDDEGNEIDPRQELVQHLLEYKKYKSVVGILEEWEERMLQREKRGNVVKEVKMLATVSDEEAELQDLDLYKLMRVFQRVMARFEVAQARPRHEVKPYPYKIEDQKAFLLEQLSATEKLSFIQIMQFNTDKVAIIFNFLAILELMALNLINMQIGMGYNNFWISKAAENQQPVVHAPAQ